MLKSEVIKQTYCRFFAEVPNHLRRSYIEAPPLLRLFSAF